MFLHIVSIARADAPEQRERLYDKMNDVMREKYDIDREDSIMDAREEKGFACRVKNMENSGGHGQYGVEVTDNDGKKFSIAFPYVDGNLQNDSEDEVMLAECYGEKISEYPSSHIAHFVYGLAPELCAELDKIHTFYGKRR